jgi:Rrf2 family protein
VIKLNRTTEYGLIAIRYMAQKMSSEPTSAREVADRYGLPFEITAKTLQRLRDLGFIQSVQGARGGYSLKPSLKAVSLAEFLAMMEGPQALVPCLAAQEAASGPSERECCELQGRCEMRGALTDLNSRLYSFMSAIPLASLIDSSMVVGGEEP